MKNHEDDMSSAVDPIEAQDALFDAAQAAILDAKDVLVSQKTRTAVAALRSQMFGESAPAGVFADGSTDDAPTNIERLTLLGRNVMIGMVQRWLNDLQVPTSDRDALTLVQAGIEITAASEGAIEMPPSPLHLILASRLPLGLNAGALPHPREVATFSIDQLLEILRVLTPTELSQLERLATPA